MASSKKHTDDANGVLLAEQSRCQALENDDFVALKELVSPDVTHTHAKGNIDNFESYFHYIQKKIKFVECKRGPTIGSHIRSNRNYDGADAKLGAPAGRK
jgi:hypothetical protein